VNRVHAHFRSDDGARRGHVCAPMTAGFFGRSVELAALANLLAEGARLVTLVGPGGAGKTRLVEHALADRATRGRALVVDLGEATGRDDVLVAIARALGLATTGDAAGVLDDVVRAAEATGLVVLDNCEPAIAGVAAVVAEWLAAAPAVRLVATSREPLRLANERVVDVGPLEPEAALAMFVERARRVRPTLAADRDRERGIIAAIVEVLDGFPLALELAASRLALVAPAELLARLQADLDAPGRGARDAPARQHTIRATIEWSWRLLSPAERTTLEELAVFRRTFDAAAAEGVSTSPDALAHLGALREKSLVRNVDRGGGAPRFALYVAVRQFAEEALARDPERAELARRRHAAYFAAAANRLEALDPTELATLAAPPLRDLENYRAVVARAATAPPDDAGAWAAGAAVIPVLEPMVVGREPLAPWLALVDALLAHPAATGAARARVLAARARARLLAGADPALIDADLADGRRLAADAPLVRARLGWIAAWLAYDTRGDVAGARAELEAARELTAHERPARASTRALEARLDYGLALVLRRLGDLAGARARCEEAAATARALRFDLLVGPAVGYLGVIAADAGDHARADAALAEAITALDRIRDRRDRAYFAGARAVVALDRGEVASAAAQLDTALAMAIGLGDRRVRAQLLAWRARASGADDSVADAERYLREALAILRDVPLVELEVLVRAELSGVLSARGRELEAREALSAAAGLVARTTGPTARAVVDAYAALAGDPGARDRLAAARPHAAHSTDVRHALAVVDRILDARTRGAIVLDGAVLRVFGGAPVDLARRTAAHRLLVALAGAHAAGDGRALAIAELFAAGWPGQRATAESAANRVHVALNLLRRVGLRAVIQSSRDGYRLDPAVVVRRA
jgi:predicted ATPase